MNVVLGEKLGKRVTPVQHGDYVNSPTIGYIVEDETGFIALPVKFASDASCRLNRHDAITYLMRVWEGR